MRIIIFLSLAIDLSLRPYRFFVSRSVFISKHLRFGNALSVHSTTVLLLYLNSSWFFKSVPIIPGFSVKLHAVPGASSSTTPCWIRWDKQILGSKSGSVGWSCSNAMHAKESLKKCHRVMRTDSWSKARFKQNISFMKFMMDQKPKQLCP